MPLFSANISTLYGEYPVLERVAQAASAGFDAIEIQFPYDEDPEAFARELEKHNLPLVLMNFPCGDLMSGGEGLAAVPGKQREFEQALTLTEQFARILRPQALNLLSGQPGPQYDRDECEQVFKDNLRKAYELTRKHGIRLLTEPVNTVDLPDFYLHGTEQAIELIESLPDIELFIQYDLYHMQIMESNLLERIPEIIDRIGHFQFSDVPRRTEPGLGTIDFEPVFSLIDSLGFEGYVGAEYFPTINTSATLDWMRFDSNV